MSGLPVDSRLLVMARDPVAADAQGTYLMGFDPRKIPTIVGAAAPQYTALGKVALAQSEIMGNVALKQARCSFVPTKGWMERLCNAQEEWPDQW